MFWNPSKLGALDRDLLEYFCCVASLSLATFGCNNAALGCALVRVALQGQTITAAPVLQALMAFASLHRYGLQSQALELKVAALGSLAQEPRAPSLGVEATLQHAATGMLLCSFEMHQSSSTSGHWPFYLGGVKAVFGACSTKTLHQLGSDVAVLLDWVHYHDVLARFSLLHWTKGGSSDLPPAPTDFFCPQLSFCKQQFPIHVIGCEARTDEQRAAVLDVISRTEKMSSSRSLNYCKRILQAVWAQDDLVNGCNIGYREKLSSIGAGIQLSPNATRLLQRWGVFEEVLQYAAQPEAGTFRSYRGDMLSQSLPVSHPTLVREEAPYIVIHRADLLRALLSGMERHGITLKLSSEVKEINFHKPSIRLSNDEVYEADLILGADGERSRCRGILLGREDPPHSPGDVVYRISVPTKNIAEGHAAWDLKRRCSVNFWMGPGGHVVSYLIQHDILNLVLVYTEGAGGKVMYGPQRADLDEFRSKIVNWDPVLHELINVPGSVCTKWTLFQIHEVIQWRHESGRFVLIGDAAHAILPCLAQGAAQAFEDAGVLGAIFSQPVGRDQIPDALRVFEEVRKPRASDVRHCTLEQKAMFALSDGPGQEERDAGLRAGADHGLFRWLWEYDAAESGREAWEAFLNKAREDGIEPRHDN
ncbi:hypothetical protein VD0003_g7958 [Verticillium dahliae]|nr:hypothetical protein VD0003_g7958 [Verticillium dahliae]